MQCGLVYGFHELFLRGSGGPVGLGGVLYIYIHVSMYDIIYIYICIFGTTGCFRVKMFFFFFQFFFLGLNENDSQSSWKSLWWEVFKKYSI